MYSLIFELFGATELDRPTYPQQFLMALDNIRDTGACLLSNNPLL
jgi:hypothetical protein